MKKKKNNKLKQLQFLLLTVLLLPLQCFASGHIPSFSIGELLLALLPFPSILILSFFTFGFIRIDSPKAGLCYIIQLILTIGVCYFYYWNRYDIDGWLWALLIPLAINTILIILNLIKVEEEQGQEP